MIKRVFDVVVSSAALAVSAPLMALIALAIKSTSEGPIIFTQERVGRRGKPFRIFKFRTMRINDGPAVSTTTDPRITRVGRLLRASKLDELPQFANVVRGEMSLVGPRPEVREYVEKWPDELRPVILSVRPGITDPASIQFRNEAEILASVDDPETHYVETILPQKAAAYAEYVRTRSFTGDLAIIARTAKAVAVG